jgi:hypothetical protein
MLTCDGHEVRLPQNDIAYLAFRLAVHETLADIDLHLDLGEEPDPAVGYLTVVPFLKHVPLPVQVDLLADTWSRHWTSEFTEASLLDAAIVYAACRTASRIVSDEPKIALVYLKHGPHSVNPRIVRRAWNRLDDLFDRFWDDRDFLMIDEWQDLPPDQAGTLKAFMGVPDEMVQPMYDALQRWHVSQDIAAKLAGLLTDKEITAMMPLLECNAWPPRPRLEDDDDESGLLTGIEDRYHDLMVGPCDPAAVGAEECALVWNACVSRMEDFDCTFEEWSRSLRADVLRAIEEKPCKPARPLSDGDIAARVRQATTTGLEDGTRIEPRDDGWVVICKSQGLLDSYLTDPEHASWVIGDDDEMPPAVFCTAEEAYAAWAWSEEVAAERVKRREEALKRLGKMPG